MNQVILPLLTKEENSLPFCIKSIGGWKNQEHVLRPAGYPDYQWLHCTKGEGRLSIGGKEHTIPENTGFFFRPGVPHEYFAINEPWETRWITLNGYALPQLLETLGLGDWEVLFITDIQLLEGLWNEVYFSIRPENPSKGFESSALLYQFLISMRNFTTSSDSRMKYPKQKQLQPVILYIEKKYNTALSLEEMASVINVTPYHLCRLFKQAFSMRPFVYITRFRIQKAKELMMQSNSLSIKDLAQNVGYNDASYFCSVFKEFEGITPMEFKRMHHII